MSEIYYYTGKDNLDVMKNAINYNNFLLHLIYKNARLNDVIVDFGAGAGTFAKPVSENYKQVICIEIDPILKNKLKDQGLSVFEDINELQDESIDFLYSFNVLEHIKNDEDFLKLWYRKLAPHGRILIYVPAFNILYSSLDRKVGHFRRYTKKELNSKLINAGFSVKNIRYADSAGFFASIIFKYFGNDDGLINEKMLKIYDRYAFPVSRLGDMFLSHIFGKNVYAIAEKI